MKISVIIPAYNHEQYIGSAIESVLNQTFGDFELIIINDGSTDNTEKIILQYDDPRIRYYSQENRGAHNTINRGISLANGEYVSILNSDDIYHPERLNKCTQFLEENSNYSVIITEIEGIDNNGKLIGDKIESNAFGRIDKLKIILDWIKKLPFMNRLLRVLRGKPLWIDHDERAINWWRWYSNILNLSETIQNDFYLFSLSNNILVTTSNFFMKKEIFDKVGFFRGLRYAHDWDMLLRLSRVSNIHFYRQILLQYRIHELNTIIEAESLAKTRFEVNWLIAGNIRNLTEQIDMKRLIDSVKKNTYISLDVLVMLLLINNERQIEALLDFNNPITRTILQML